MPKNKKILKPTPQNSSSVVMYSITQVMMIVLCASVVVMYLISTNASAMRSLQVSELEREIEELMIEKSELSIQEAHLRHKAYGDITSTEQMVDARIVGYITLPEYSNDASVLALSE